MITATKENEPLTSALDAVDAAMAGVSEPSQLLVAAKVRGLLRGYDARWSKAGYVALEVEKILTADLVNPATGAKSRSFQLAGKLDVIARSPAGQLVLFDHKSTSQDITDPNSPYWRQLVVEGQPNHYCILGWANGLKFDNVIWNVLRKPQIRPAKLSKAERTSVVSSRSYFGTRVSDATLDAMQVDERETLELYEARLSHDCTTERPEWYFARRAIPRIDAEILEYAQQLWEIGQDILAVRNNERHYKNSGACMLYGTPCVFLGCCSGHDDITSDNWQHKEKVHPELATDGDGRDILTNSRVRTFQTCRRLHHYKYDLGVERVDEEEKETLFFGSLWHTALEQYFIAGMESGK